MTTQPHERRRSLLFRLLGKHRLQIQCAFTPAAAPTPLLIQGCQHLTMNLRRDGRTYECARCAHVFP